MPKRKDALIIAAVLAAAVLLLAASRLAPRANLSEKMAQETLAPDAIAYLDETPAPEESAMPAAEPDQAAEPSAEGMQISGPMPAPQTQEVKGYVVIRVGKRQYGDPIPMDRDKVITIRQDDGRVNKIHITPEKVYMESSTCENQDCVGQGEVTLDNYRTRILSTYVICLPNEVTIELVPAE